MNKPETVKMIEAFLSGAQELAKVRKDGPHDENDPLLAFSVELEDMVAYENDELKAWSKEVWAIFSQELPELCADIGSDSDLKPFVQALSDIYERAMKARKP